MKPTETHHGRPLFSRIKHGFGLDLRNLKKLRFATLADPRISMRSYQTVAHAVRTIERVLNPYAKPRSHSKKEPKK